MKEQKHTNNTAILCFVLYALSSCATASEPSDPCETARNQAEMTTCWTTQAKDAQAAMNTRYKEVINAVEVKKDTQLLSLTKQSQEAWEQYKQAQCKLEAAQFEGGSKAAMTMAICEQRLATSREQELKAIRDTSQ
jgi:uncharacterized protein YecT (DUF1311 family)